MTIAQKARLALKNKDPKLAQKVATQVAQDSKMSMSELFSYFYKPSKKADSK